MNWVAVANQLDIHIQSSIGWGITESKNAHPTRLNGRWAWMGMDGLQFCRGVMTMIRHDVQRIIHVHPIAIHPHPKCVWMGSRGARRLLQSFPALLVHPAPRRAESRGPSRAATLSTRRVVALPGVGVNDSSLSHCWHPHPRQRRDTPLTAHSKCRDDRDHVVHCSAPRGPGHLHRQLPVEMCCTRCSPRQMVSFNGRTVPSVASSYWRAHLEGPTPTTGANHSAALL